MVMSMRIEQLSYLIEISKNSSLNQSSKKLHISYQGLSNAINSLENELGYPILDRSPKGVKLTAKGKILVEAASTFLQTLSELAETPHIETPHIKAPSDYTIYSTYSATYTSIPGFLSYLYKNFPNTNFLIKHYPAEKCSQLLRDEKISFALYDRCILNETIINNDSVSDLLFIPLTTINHCFAVVPSNFPISDLKQVSINHLLEYPIILQYETNPEFSLKPIIEYRSMQKSKKIIYESNWRIIQQMLLANLGILLTIDIPSLFAKSGRTDRLKVIPISDSIEIQSGYLYHNAQNFSPFDSYILNDYSIHKSYNP